MTQGTILYLVRLCYLLLIAGLTCTFVGYITLDLIARARGRFPRPERVTKKEPEFERLSLNQRVQHWVLIASFITLLITGLPLAAPGSRVSQGFTAFFGGLGVRAAVHRAAALVLIAVCAYHVGYVLCSRRGYWEFRQLIPGRQDAADVIQTLKFYFGLSPVRARFGRYSFVEKCEYLAVGWGSVVMAATGAVLWTPQFSLAYLPKWMLDVALIVHSWEAILAFLTIIVWHMYNVHFNPSVFPMSRVWLTGRVKLRELQENHPLEYEHALDRPEAARQEEGVGTRYSEPHTGPLVRPLFRQARMPFTGRNVPVWLLLSVGTPAILFLGLSVLCVADPRIALALHHGTGRGAPAFHWQDRPVRHSDSARRPLTERTAARRPSLCEARGARTAPESHGPLWLSQHGKVSQAQGSSCAVCHGDSSCNTCHGVTMPHPDSWVGEHGKQAEAAPAKCSKCHTATRSDCRACHRGLAPSSHQKDSWKAQHPTAGATEMDLCELCHGRDACNSCHAAKVGRGTAGR